METLISPISLDYFSERTLTAKAGISRPWWPEMVAKELVDNALDAAEASGIAPIVRLTVRPDYIEVTDNGSGIPTDAIRGAFDFGVRASTKAKRISPTRGSQGEAFKQLAAVPVVLSGDRGRLEIGTRGSLYSIDIRLDQIAQQPVVTIENGSPFIRSGTSVRIYWPKSACPKLSDPNNQFLQLASRYAAFNPHVDITVDLLKSVYRFEPTTPDWSHWTEGRTNAHWWTETELSQYLAALLAMDRQNGRDRPIREVIATFEGLAGSAKGKRILEATGLTRAPLSSIVSDDALDHLRISSLLSAMQEHSTPTRPQRLGLIGQEHLLRQLGEVNAPAYVKKIGEDFGRPFVVEVAFGHCLDDDDSTVFCGVNWSPSVQGQPFDEVCGRSFDRLLADRYCGEDEPVRLIVHVTTPRVNWSDQGKTAVSFDRTIGHALVDSVMSATKAWHKQREAERRNVTRRVRREEMLEKQCNTTRSLKSIIFELLPELTRELQGDNQWLPSHRHLFYQARKRVEDFTDKPLISKTFESITKQFEEERGELACYREARGFLIEPHTGREIPLGTKQVDAYDPPRYLFDKIIFVEKRAMWPIIQQMRIAERFDAAVVCSEGFAVRACRNLLRTLQKDQRVQIACVHDADPAGFMIARTLREATKRTPFVIDLYDFGLTVEEAVAMGATGETFIRKNALPSALEESLTGLSKAWFTGEKQATSNGKSVWKCRRVKLNELTPAQFAAWLEQKIHDHGMDAKLVPPDDVVRERSRSVYDDKVRQRVRAHIESRLDVDAMVDRAVARIPEADASRVVASMAKWAKATPESRWTQHVETVVADQLGRRRKTIIRAADAAMEGEL